MTPEAMDLKATVLKGIGLPQKGLASPERGAFPSVDEEVGPPITHLRCHG